MPKASIRGTSTLSRHTTYLQAFRKRDIGVDLDGEASFGLPSSHPYTKPP